MIDANLRLVEAKKKASDLAGIARMFDEIELPVETHMYLRAKPKPYLEASLALFKAIGGQVIAEIGCMRDPIEHPIDEIHPYCCNDGHSTYFWALSGAEVYSVDVSPKAVRNARESCRDFPNVQIYQADGIDFLVGFTRPIDLLYLDAWDIEPGSDYDAKHLAAFRAARPHLKPNHIVSIDDTDIGGGGKGRLLVPELELLGYDILVRGRQTIAIQEAKN